jgi:SAM-dependent methyltransferase
MNCRICDTPTVQSFLSFGKLPLGNAFLKADEIKDEQLFDLTLGFCPTCTLVQSMNPPPIDVLQRDYRDYKYVPVGASLVDNLLALGKELGAYRVEPAEGPETGEWGRFPFVVDIGSNSGVLLKGAQSVAARVLGIEPATGIAEQANRDGITTVNMFFDMEVAKGLREQNGPADVVVTTQTLQHVPDPVAFCQAVKHLLKPGGRFVIEGRYFVDTVEKGNWDTIYHEMMSCFTIDSMRNLLMHTGFFIEQVKMVDTYGGSLRVYARSFDAATSRETDSPYRYWADPNVVREMKIIGGDEYSDHTPIDYYHRFAAAVAISGHKIWDLVLPLKAKGARIVAYGAPSTSTTLLNFCKLGDCIDYIVDDNPLKQGLFHPGTHIPVLSSATLEARRPDYIFLTAWQFAESIMKKTAHLEAKYILPFPTPKVLPAVKVSA